MCETGREPSMKAVLDYMAVVSKIWALYKTLYREKITQSFERLITQFYRLLNSSLMYSFVLWGISSCFGLFCHHCCSFCKRESWLNTRFETDFYSEGVCVPKIHPYYQSISLTYIKYLGTYLCSSKSSKRYANQSTLVSCHDFCLLRIQFNIWEPTCVILYQEKCIQMLC